MTGGEKDAPSEAALEVHDREAALSAIRESEERARTFAEASFEGLFIHENGVVLDVNERLLQIFRMTRADVIGQSAFEFADPSSHETVRRNIAADYDQPYEAIGRRKDGTTFPLELLGRTMHVAGRTLRVTAARDITERKRTELALREAETALLQAQKLESLGLLAGGIAHDFNNILGIVLGFAAVAKRQLPEGAPARGALDEIETAAMRAAELARQMLVYSGRSPKSIAELSLNAVVAEMARLVEASVSRKITIALDLDPSACATMADRAQLQQVVMNLLTNAAEAIGANRGVIRVATRVVDIEAGTVPAAQPGTHVPAGSYVELMVQDDGVGMDDATLARIFDPFFTTKTSGRGLGLSAMLGILRGHGAGLSIQTKVRQGTCFRVYFPVAPPRTRPTTVPPPRHESTQTGTILLVDDEHALRRATRELLEAIGFAVIEAKDGAEAVARFGEHHREIALVLLDLVMPQMDGRETLRAIHAIDQKARVVLMSGYDAGEVQDGIRDEVAGFLAKPFTADALTETVRAAL